eukprot:gnl/Dysnectes_brevis/624_a691_5986.p1 GENE.gnl/Dysnectes_brevis/624_a691_5986~~gnl/Dysnectes_brevis/624_a691_5986.p1  ORF type:complete len:223 (-),score=77.19 gnl/Dysnectes_brevis/624_a691_5986:40-708(-)
MPLFRKKKAATSTVSPQASIKALRLQQERLEQNATLYHTKAEGEHTKAKEFLRKGQRRRAAQSLKNKQLFEKQAASFESQALGVGSQLMTMESANITITTLAAQREAVKIQKEMMKQNNIDDIQDIVDEIGDAMEEAAEIQDMLGDMAGTAIDDGELDAELDALEADAALDQFDVAGPAPVSTISAPAAVEAPTDPMAGLMTDATEPAPAVPEDAFDGLMME